MLFTDQKYDPDYFHQMLVKDISGFKIKINNMYEFVAFEYKKLL